MNHGTVGSMYFDGRCSASLVQSTWHLAAAHVDGPERERVTSDPYLSKLSMRDYVRSKRES